MIKVIPDSSFYICFIDDINEPEYLIRVMSANAMEFIIGQKIKEEIKRSQNYNAIEIPIDNHTQSFEYYEYGEILKPFFSAEEIKKAAKKLEGVRLMLDHSSSVKDIAGKVTKAEYDPEVKGIRFEAEVIREDIAKLILEGLIQGVSVGVVVDRHIEGGRLVARNYDFNELSLVITPACEKCVITDVKTS